MLNPKKLSFTIFLALLPAFLIVIGSKAVALPFHRSCASMEKFFQARFTVNRSGDRLGFSGFSNGYYGDDPNSFESRKLGDIASVTCDGGYITITSPQGARVCKGTLRYRDPRTGFEYFGPGMSYAYEDKNCRWR